MTTVLWNPTDRLGEKFQEKFSGHYLGVGTAIEPGQKVKVDDARARHILNMLAPRGLVALDYGDDSNLDKIAEEALKRNRDFKIKQVNDQNERNEARKAIGLPFLMPTETMRLYAEELGEDLVQPYRVKDQDRGRVTDLEKENAVLKEQIRSMNEKLDLILNAKTGREATNVKEVVESEEEAAKDPRAGPGRPRKDAK